jgi:hypothetical protein
MLVPWVLWWCLHLVIEGRFSLSIVGILFLLVNAHNITGLLAMVPISFAFVLYVYNGRNSGIKPLLRQPLLAIGIFTVLMLPELILEKQFLHAFNPSKITQDGYEATNQFVPIGRYFHDVHYTWLNNWTSLTVQLDYGIWIVAVALGLWVLINRRRKTPSKGHAYSLPGLFLVSCPLLFLFLQLRISRPIYELTGVLQYLQFPWRLLVYITPLGLLLIVWLLSGVQFKRKYLHVGVFAWVCVFLVLSPIPRQYRYAFLPINIWKSGVYVNQRQTFGGSLLGIGEYLPRLYKGREELSTRATTDIYKQLATRPLADASGCKITEWSPAHHESLVFIFDVSCVQRSNVALPVSFNDYSRVTNIASGKQLTYTRYSLDDPRIGVEVPAGNSVIRINLPTVRGVL